MKTTIRVSSVAAFDDAFGHVGLRGGPRTGPDKRSQDDEEWYVVRRFLRTGLRSGLFQLPLSIAKGSPPEPDFILHWDDGGSAAIEITEATHPDDQREMTRFEQSGETVALLGTFGGRFADGASQPGHAWASDIIEAIERKAGKTICAQHSRVQRHLVIYPNSNASFLLFDDEREAFSFLDGAITAKKDDLLKGANGCFVHVLAATYLYFDVLGQGRLLKRESPTT